MSERREAQKATDEQTMKNHWITKAATLSEALPYLQKYAGKTFVIKYGGHAMGNRLLRKQFANDVVLMKHVGINPIVVHGGGPQIGNMLERLNIKSTFVDGLRVTDQETIEIVEMVLAGNINKQIVTAINDAGGTAVGLSGKDGQLIQARKLQQRTDGNQCNNKKDFDLGFVGEPSHINTGVLNALTNTELIPVIAPIGIGEDSTTFNINADTVAGAVASAICAERLLMLTDVAGVLNKDGELIAEMSSKQVEAYKIDGTIHGGMIPKVDTCLKTIKNGVNAAVILDGRVSHALILEIFTEHGAGTILRNTGEKSREKHGCS